MCPLVSLPTSDLQLQLGPATLDSGALVTTDPGPTQTLLGAVAGVPCLHSLVQGEADLGDQGGSCQVLLSHKIATIGMLPSLVLVAGVDLREEVVVEAERVMSLILEHGRILETLLVEAVVGVEDGRDKEGQEARGEDGMIRLATNNGLDKMGWDHPMSLNGPPMMELIINGPPMMGKVPTNGPPMMDLDPATNGQPMTAKMKHPLEPGRIPNLGQV